MIERYIRANFHSHYFSDTDFGLQYSWPPCLKFLTFLLAFGIFSLQFIASPILFYPGPKLSKSHFQQRPLSLFSIPTICCRPHMFPLLFYSAETGRSLNPQEILPLLLLSCSCSLTLLENQFNLSFIIYTPHLRLLGFFFNSPQIGCIVSLLPELPSYYFFIIFYSQMQSWCRGKVWVLESDIFIWF